MIAATGKNTRAALTKGGCKLHSGFGQSSSDPALRRDVGNGDYRHYLRLRY